MPIDFTNWVAEEGKPGTAVLNDFWVTVALDYYKENATVMSISNDFRDVDGEINYNNLMDDSAIGGALEWIKTAVPGLWKIHLRGWSYQDYNGEWDSGWDIRTDAGYEAKLLVAFPEDGYEKPEV